MTSGFAWLNELMVWLGRWVPRLLLIEPTHRGVLFGPGGSVREIPAGMFVYWPITHALVEVPITTQSVHVSGQAVACQQNAGLVPSVTVCATAVQFRITDPVLAATRVLKVHALIDNRTQAAVANHIHDDRCTWIQHARQELAGVLVDYGVVLERLDFTQLGTGVAIKNVESGNWQDEATGKRQA